MKDYPIIGGPFDGDMVEAEKCQTFYWATHEEIDGIMRVVEHEYVYSPRMVYDDKNVVREGYYHNKVIVTPD